MDIKNLPQDLRTHLRSGSNINNVVQCVTELVLNSLDAKSTAIAVRVNLLTFRIQVVDNGKGITKSNMNLVGIRYMTSKCQSLRDLKTIKTFGFRGEALASIRNISKKIVISSRPDSVENTYSKTYENKKWSAVELIKQRPSQGTTVTIEGFMYNLPVRQKRINQTVDLHEIKRSLESLAIMHPNISFNLRNDVAEKLIFQSNKFQTVSQILTNLYPQISLEDLITVKVSRSKICVSGLISKKSSTHKLQFIYLNKRPITSTKIQNLINSLLMKSLIFQKVPLVIRPGEYLNFATPIEKAEYPVYVINIRCPYSQVDLTMSPSKKTVEFKKWDVVLKCIEKAVMKLLEQENLVNSACSEQQEVAPATVVSFQSKFGVSQIQDAVKSVPVKRKVDERVVELSNKYSKNDEVSTSSSVENKGSSGGGGLKCTNRGNVKILSVVDVHCSDIFSKKRKLEAKKHNLKSEVLNEKNNVKKNFNLSEVTIEKTILCEKFDKSEGQINEADSGIEHFLLHTNNFPGGENSTSFRDTFLKPDKFKTKTRNYTKKNVKISDENSNKRRYNALKYKTNEKLTKNNSDENSNKRKSNVLKNKTNEKLTKNNSVENSNKRRSNVLKNKTNEKLTKNNSRNITNNKAITRKSHFGENNITFSRPYSSKVVNISNSGLKNINKPKKPKNNIRKTNESRPCLKTTNNALGFNIRDSTAREEKLSPFINNKNKIFPTNVFDKHIHTQSLVLNSDLNASKSNINPLLNSSINTNTLENQEKGKNLIMEMFLKSTLVFPNEEPEIKDNGTIKPAFVETTKQNLVTECRKHNTTMTMSLKFISKKTIVTNSVHAPPNLNESISEDSRNNKEKLSVMVSPNRELEDLKKNKEKMVSKCIQTTMIEHQKEFNINFNSVGQEVAPNTTLFNFVPPDENYNVTFSKYFRNLHQDEENNQQNYFSACRNYQSSENNPKFNNGVGVFPKNYGTYGTRVLPEKENMLGRYNKSGNYIINRMPVTEFENNECFRQPVASHCGAHCAAGNNYNNFTSARNTENYAFNGYNNCNLNEGKNFRRPINKYYSNYNFDFSNLNSFDESYKKFVEQQRNFERYDTLPFLKRNPPENSLKPSRNNYCNTRDDWADLTFDAKVPLYQSYNPNEYYRNKQTHFYKPHIENPISNRNQSYNPKKFADNFKHTFNSHSHRNHSEGKGITTTAKELLYKSIFRDYEQENEHYVEDQELSNKDGKYYSPFFRKPTRKAEPHRIFQKSIENPKSLLKNKNLNVAGNNRDLPCISPFFQKNSADVPFAGSRQHGVDINQEPKNKYLAQKLPKNVVHRYEKSKSKQAPPPQFFQTNDNQQYTFVAPKSGRVEQELKRGHDNGHQREHFFVSEQNNEELMKQDYFLFPKQNQNQFRKSVLQYNPQVLERPPAEQRKWEIFQQKLKIPQQEDFFTSKKLKQSIADTTVLQNNQNYQQNVESKWPEDRLHFDNHEKYNKHGQNEVLFPTGKPHNQLLPPFNSNKIYHKSRLSMRKYDTEPFQQQANDYLHTIASTNLQAKKIVQQKNLNPPLQKFSTEPFNVNFFESKFDFSPQPEQLFINLKSPDKNEEIACNKETEYDFTTPNINNSSSSGGSIEMINLAQSGSSDELLSLKMAEEEVNSTLCSGNFKPALSSTRFEVVEESPDYIETNKVCRENSDVGSDVLIERTPASTNFDHFFVPSLNRVNRFEINKKILSETKQQDNCKQVDIGSLLRRIKSNFLGSEKLQRGEVIAKTCIIENKKESNKSDFNSNKKQNCSTLNISINSLKKSQLIQRDISNDCKLNKKSETGESESIVNLENLLHFANICLFEKDSENCLPVKSIEDEWVQKIDNFDNIYYVHKRTGMTSLLAPTKHTSPFDFTKRLGFVPKGLSPIFIESKKVDVSLSPTSKKCLHATIMESYENELNTIKWSHYIHDYNDANKFFEELYREKTKQFQYFIPNTSVNSLPKFMVNLYKNLQARSFTKDLFTDLKIIGQLDRKFIVTELKEKKLLILFDQHAVHERVRLEKLLNKYKKSRNEDGEITLQSTKCDERIVIHLMTTDITVLMNFQNLFENLGLFYVAFENSIEISHIPTCIYNKFLKSDKHNKDMELKSLIISLINEQITMITSTRGVTSKMSTVLQNTINLEACRGSIKFGDQLTINDCEEHIKELSNCMLPFQCAHGRPTLTPIVTLKEYGTEITKPNLKKLKLTRNF